MSSALRLLLRDAASAAPRWSDSGGTRTAAALGELRRFRSLVSRAEGRGAGRAAPLSGRIVPPAARWSAALGEPCDAAALRIWLGISALHTLGRLLAAAWWRRMGVDPLLVRRLAAGAAAVVGPGAESAPAYDWFQPGVKAVRRVTRAVEQLDFRKPGLPLDLLGPLYEQLTLELDPRGQGRFYTPPWLVRFICERLEIPRLAPEEAPPPPVLDPCVGCGAFLLEAQRRLMQGTAGREHPGPPDPATLRRSFGAEELARLPGLLAAALCGVDIDPAACSLARLNLTIHLGPLLGALGSAAGETPLPRWRVVTADALDLEGPLWNGALITPEQPPRIVCGNPPYLGEKGHARLFREVLARWPRWQRYYRGRMDYHYWFVFLGLELLGEGGRLSYITPGYWLTADSAVKLREFILEQARILELHEIEGLELSRYGKGHHPLVFVLEKRSAGGTASDALRVFTLHAPIPGAAEDGTGPTPTPGGTFDQRSLDRGPWHLFGVGPEEERILAAVQRAGVPLAELCHDMQGVITGADRLTARNMVHLDPERVRAENLAPGAGIFVLRQAEVAELELSELESGLLRRIYHGRDVCPYVVDTGGDEPEYMIYLRHDREWAPGALPGLLRHLERFRPILERRRECRMRHRGDGRPYRRWFELQWPRDEARLGAPSLVTARRAAGNCFAWEPHGWFESSDLTVLTTREGAREDPLYLLALLNSALLDFWYARRSKRKGPLREYYSSPLQRVPIVPAPSPGGGEGNGALHDRLVELTARMIAVRTALAELGARAGVRLVRTRPGADPPALPEALPGKERARVRELQTKAAEIQGTIDELVLDLYGITDPRERSLVLAGRLG
jgi:hypothetical protein